MLGVQRSASRGFPRGRMRPGAAMSERATILEWTERGAVRDAEVALTAAGVLPNARDWRAFIDRLLLWSGAAALGAAVIFFVAHNWGALGRYAKFGMLEALVVAAVVAYWRLGPDRAAGKAALLVACLVLGALLALVGQTYQTGADSFELFAVWAALIAPWVVVGRSAALWVLWLALLNLGIALYFRAFGGWPGLVFTDEGQLWVLFVANTVALAAWELAARRVSWLDVRWAPRAIAAASGAALTVLVIHALLAPADASKAALLVYPLWLAVVYACYVRSARDVLMVSGACLSLIAVVTTFAARHLLRAVEDAGAFLVLAVIVIGMAAAAGSWLKRLAAEERVSADAERA